MQYMPGELALLNLRGEFDEDERGYMTRDQALESLREISNRDFGTDLEAWSKWIETHYAKSNDLRRRAIEGE